MKLLPSRRVLCTSYNHAPCHFMQSHIRKVYACLAVTCHLHFCGNTGGGMDTEIRVSTESRPWRRKFSRRSCRDSNPRPFNHESGALTTELSPPPLFFHMFVHIISTEIDGSLLRPKSLFAFGCYCTYLYIDIQWVFLLKALCRGKRRQQEEQNVTFVVAFTVHTMSAASGLNFLCF